MFIKNKDLPANGKTEKFAQKKISLSKSIPYLLKGRSPGQLIIQLTDRCNARCPQCGMRTSNRFSRSVIDVDVAKRAIDHAAKEGVQSISFTGGEPFLVMDLLLDLIRHAQSAGIPYIRTGTNGYFFINDELQLKDRVTHIAEALAKTGLYTFWISIDSSCRDTHEKMRGLSGVISGIEKALPIFHDCGIFPAANLGINRNMNGENKIIGSDITPNDTVSDIYYLEKCREAFESYYQFIIDLGFTMTNTCYPMSFAATDNELFVPVYEAVSSDSVVRFTKAEKAQLFKALFDTIPKFRSKIRIFTPRASLYSLMSEYNSGHHKSYGCLGGIDYYFLECTNGDAFPCGYRGSENLGKFWEIDFSKRKSKPECRLCDWECFRDPSTMLGFIVNPKNIINSLLHDREFLSIWKEDLSYYKACGFFNARQPLPVKKLEKFK